MRQSLTICTLLMAAAALASPADAGMILESESGGFLSNNTRGTAESIAASAFTVDPSGDIFSAADGRLSGTAYTATVVGELGTDSSDIDFFRFDMVDDGFAWFDVDTPFMQFSTLQLFDAAGTLIARDQLSSFGGSPDSGSATIFDPFIGETLLSAGTYFVAISEGASSATGGGGYTVSLQTPSFGLPPVDLWSAVSGATIGDSSFNTSGAEGEEASSYHLHISQIRQDDVVQTPAPTSFLLMTLGAVGLAGARSVRRLRRAKDQA